MTHFTHVDYIRHRFPKGESSLKWPVEIRLLQETEEQSSGVFGGEGGPKTIDARIVYGCYACGNVYETAAEATACNHDCGTPVWIVWTRATNTGQRAFAGCGKIEGELEVL